MRLDLLMAGLVGVIISDFLINNTHWLSLVFGILGCIVLINWDWF